MYNAQNGAQHLGLIPATIKLKVNIIIFLEQ